MRPLLALLCLLIALLIMNGCKIQMDLDFASDGSGSGVIMAKGRDLPDDANGFRNDLVKRGFTVDAVRSAMTEGERKLTADVTWPPFADGFDHPLIRDRRERDGAVSWKLRKNRLDHDIPSEIRLSLPGSPLSASGGRIDGRMVVYPGPDSSSEWVVTFKPGMGVSGKLILAAVAVLALVAAAIWALRQSAKTPSPRP